MTAFVDEVLTIAVQTHYAAGDLYDQALRQLERQLFDHVLRLTGGNQLHASRILGIGRGTLRQKLRALGVTIDRRPGRPPAREAAERRLGAEQEKPPDPVPKSFEMRWFERRPSGRA